MYTFHLLLMQILNLACKDNLENSFTTKVSKRTTCVFSLSAKYAFDDDKKEKHDKYRS